MESKNELSSLVGEKDALSNATAMARIMADMMQHHERENKRLWMIIIVQAIVSIVIAACMVWAVQNAQNVANEAMINALNTVAEMEVVGETTTTTVNQDTGESNGNNIYQSGESATYNEAAVSSAETGE